MLHFNTYMHFYLEILCPNVNDGSGKEVFNLNSHCFYLYMLCLDSNHVTVTFHTHNQHKPSTK